MLRAIGPIVAFALMATVVACSGRDPVADGANNVTGLPAANANAPSPPDGSPPANATAPAEPAAPSSKIPAALQGRWGLTPGDCTSALGDAKGLLVVNDSELRFYESRAVPGANAQAVACLAHAAWSILKGFRTATTHGISSAKAATIPMRGSRRGCAR